MPRRAMWLFVCAGCCDTAAAAGGAVAADGAAAVRPYGSVAQPQLSVPGRGTVVWVLLDPPMPGFLLLAPLLDLERDVFAAAVRPVSGCAAAVSRAGATAKIGGCVCVRACAAPACGWWR